MKNISFLFSASRSKTPKTGLLLQNNIIVVIDKDMEEEEDKASEVAQEIISDTIVENVKWWWPSSRAFNEIHGVSEFGVMNVLEDYGFTVSPNARLSHTQVDDDKTLEDYIEIQISLSDDKYVFLSNKYGNIKIN